MQQHRAKVGLLHPRSSQLMWNKNSIRLVLLNLSQPIVLRLLQQAWDGHGARRSCLCPGSRTCATAQMLTVFLCLQVHMLFAAPAGKNSFPTARQVKRRARGHHLLVHSQTSSSLGLCAHLRIAPCHNLLRRNSYLFIGIGFALIVFLNLV